VKDVTNKQLENDMTPNLRCPTDRCKEEATEERSYITEKNTPSLVKALGDEGSVFESAFYKYTLESINKEIKKKNYLFTSIKSATLKKIKEKKIDKYLSKIGKIVSKHGEDYFIVTESAIYLIRVHYGTFIKLILEIKTYRMENITQAHEHVINVLKDIMVPKVNRVDLEWAVILENEIKYLRVEEILDDNFLAEAYPYINIDNLIENYINNTQPVLILYGKPGTGKTRLIRHILENLASKDDDSSVSCLFTSDQRIIEDGSVFTRFLMGNYRILILEDVDFHLTPRTDGNTSMYHLLNISDGVASNYMKDKKIILTTNLNTINNIDSALLRPGRCFNTVEMKDLDYNQAKILSKILGKNLELAKDKKYTLGEIYNSKEYNTYSNKKVGF
jgi:ATP-dependent 26S proteasome regulatory subunit